MSESKEKRVRKIASTIKESPPWKMLFVVVLLVPVRFYASLFSSEITDPSFGPKVAEAAPVLLDFLNYAPMVHKHGVENTSELNG